MAKKTSGTRSVVVMIIGLFLLLLLSFIHVTQGQADYTVAQLVKEVWTEGRVQDIVLSLRLPRLVNRNFSGRGACCGWCCFTDIDE